MNKIPFRADLHCHSTFSDGTDSPQTLVDLAIASGLSGLSITDHDTLAAYPAVLDYAKQRGLLMISGIELSASYRGDPVHILGYGFDLKNQALANFCEAHHKRRMDRNLEIIENLRKLGLNLNLDISKSGSFGRPHIAAALIEMGVVDSIQEAFARYLGEGKLAYAPGRVVEVAETIETIREASGKAILAHPHLIKRSTTVRAMLQMPFDGLEGYYARFGPDQEKKWIEIAKQKNWIITGGSDYHGSIKPQSKLGSSWVDQEIFEKLMFTR